MSESLIFTEVDRERVPVDQRTLDAIVGVPGEPWFRNSSTLTTKQQNLIELLTQGVLDPYEFANQWKRLLAGGAEGFLKKDRGELVMTPEWLMVHKDWVSKAVKLEQERWRLARQFFDLPEGFGGLEEAAPGYWVWEQNLRSFVRLFQDIGRPVHRDFIRILPEKPTEEQFNQALQTHVLEPGDRILGQLVRALPEPPEGEP